LDFELGRRKAIAAELPEPLPAPLSDEGRSPSPLREALASRLPKFGVLLAASVAAYHYSLLTLPQALGVSTLLAYGGLIVVALGLTAWSPSPTGPASRIHDRYTDFIIGAPLLTAALAIVLLLPTHLSVFFWLWRLDLISLPLFAASAVVVLFGTRAAWRFRLPLALLFLAWPLALGRFGAGPASTRLALILLGIAVILVLRRTLLSPPPLWGRVRVGGIYLPAVHRPLATFALLALAAAAIGSGSHLQRYELLMTGSGEPRLASTQSATPITGWSSQQETSYPWIKRMAGADARWDRYSYRRELKSGGAQLPTPQILVDVISTSNLAILTNHKLDAFFRLHENRLFDSRPVDLGGGITGEVAVYSSPGYLARWTAVYWDWPVRGSDGELRYERMVVSPVDPEVQNTGTLLTFAQLFIKAAASNLVSR
jgi:hypothetical protein